MQQQKAARRALALPQQEQTAPQNFYFAQSKSDVHTEVPKEIETLELKESKRHSHKHKDGKKGAEKEGKKEHHSKKKEKKEVEKKEKDKKERPPAASQVQLDSEIRTEDPDFPMMVPPQMFGQMMMPPPMMPVMQPLAMAQWGPFQQPMFVGTDEAGLVAPPQLHWNEDPHSVPLPSKGYLTSTQANRKMND